LQIWYHQSNLKYQILKQQITLDQKDVYQLQMNTYLDQEDLPHINRFSNAVENTNMMGRPSSLTR